MASLNDAKAPGHDWPEPEPLRAPLKASELYPVMALGELLGNAAQMLHEVIKSPLSLCCQSVLGSAALAAQQHFDVKLPWGEIKPLSLFLLTCGESGERKTAVDNVVLGAAKSQERLDMERYKIDKKRFDDGEKDLAPIKPLRFITEPTAEGLYKLLEIGQPSIGMFSDEGGLLIGGHALNSDNALKTMARWCKLWEGAPFDRVRGGDGSGILYGRRLALHQMAQPEVMTMLLGSRMANSQGFLARCLVAWPESTIGKRQIQRFESASDRQEYTDLFDRLKRLLEKPPSVRDDLGQELSPTLLELSSAAAEVALIALNKFETLMDEGNDLVEIRDRASKAVENACRIAGVLATVEKGLEARTIGRDYMERALVLIQWYLAEWLRIRGAALMPQSVLDAESLSKWLDSRSLKQFRSVQVLQHGPNQLRNKHRLDAAIHELESNGYILLNEPGTQMDGVKPKKSWQVLHVV